MLTHTDREVPTIVCHKAGELSGSTRVSGSKNVGLKLLTITPLFSQPVTLTRVPANNQVRYVLDLLKDFGAEVKIHSDDLDGLTVTIHAKELSTREFEYQEIRWCRHVFLLAVSVLLRTGSVVLSIPGYSHYGARPIDGQLNGLKQMGAIVHAPEGGLIRIELPHSGLVGKEIFLPFPSNAVTEALLWSAVAAEGETVIHGAAQEPETLEIGKFFQQAGVEIDGLGTARIKIQGRGLSSLQSPTNFTIMPDRIEAATLGAAVSLCGGEILLRDIRGEHMAAVRSVLMNMGTQIEESEDSWLLRASGKPIATDISTGPFPGFPTDGLGPYVAALSVAKGVSVLQERLWSNRLSLAMELKRMGATIDLPSGQVAIIRGLDHLSGAPVIGTDPRATAALILAGMVADGETLVCGIDLLDNAYDSLDEKLRGLGANVQRTSQPASVYDTHHPIYGRLEAF